MSEQPQQNGPAIIESDEGGSEVETISDLRFPERKWSQGRGVINAWSSFLGQTPCRPDLLGIEETPLAAEERVEQKKPIS